MQMQTGKRDERPYGITVRTALKCTSARTDGTTDTRIPHSNGTSKGAAAKVGRLLHEDLWHK